MGRRFGSAWGQSGGFRQIFQVQQAPLKRRQATLASDLPRNRWRGSHPGRWSGRAGLDASLTRLRAHLLGLASMPFKRQGVLGDRVPHSSPEAFAEWGSGGSNGRSQPDGQ
jgi:hypothetical protein